jgi:hypothetical protein
MEVRVAIIACMVVSKSDLFTRFSRLFRDYLHRSHDNEEEDE